MESAIEANEMPMSTWEPLDEPCTVFEGYHVTSPDAEAQEQELRRLLTQSAQEGAWRLSVTRLRNENWQESWKRHFHTMRVSPRLVVKPSWERYTPRADDVVIEIDPGLSFGTGLHPTTQSCLLLLDRESADSPPRSCLDVGCGSGILSIAATGLGYSPVVAVDNDPKAIEVASDNCRHNNCPDIQLQTAELPDLPLSETFDLVVANILADVLIDYASSLVCYASREVHARLIVSGILNEQFEAVADAYRAHGFRVMREVVQGEWTTGLLRPVT